MSSIDYRQLVRRLPSYVVLLAAAALALRRLDDSDTWWHLAAGRWIAENARVPVTDPFSHTVPAHAWVNLQWLYDLVLYGLWQVGGANLLVLSAVAAYTGAVTGPGGMVSVGGRLDVDTSLYVYQGTLAYRVLDDTTRVDLLDLASGAMVVSASSEYGGAWKATRLVDGGTFNTVPRPAIYLTAHHEIVNAVRVDGTHKARITVAGNLCETGDVFGRERSMPLPESGDVLAVLCAGAYCRSMASNFNLRQIPREVLV